MKSIHCAFALTAAIAVAGFTFSANPAVAANSAMADCNKQWNDATAAKTTNGVAYQDYLKTCLKKASSTTGAAAATTTTTTTTAATKPAAATTMAAATDTATSGDAKAKKDCNAQWKTAKADGSAGTQKKKDFVAACLTKAGVAPADTMTTTKKPATTTGAATTGAATTGGAAATTTTMAPATDTTPPEPTGNATTTTDTKTKDGKPKSAGQIAMDARIKECGADWKKAKADGTTNGLKWPQYWSACNKRLKAAGQ